ncbi:DUF6191 domain-containing protein [Streptomyces sp. NPDC000594]|uniref:DUF6191 domain-containing protein n=1 Tax=Streptomyces sp. NPDC000594 TaxID=3154261 RepID=UPI00333131A7
MFGGIEEIFTPGSRHLADERNRLELTREDAGSADPCRGPIDLTSGVVLLRRDTLPLPPGDGPEGEPGNDTADTPDSTADSTEAIPAP